MNPRYRWPAALAAAVLLLAAGAALYTATSPGRAAPPGDLDAQVRDVASRLRCLQCQGLSAWQSNSESSLRMREEIRAMLEGGMTPEEIIRHYVDRYGTWVLMSPPVAGFGALAYVVPAAGLALGAWGLRRYLRAGSGARAVQPSARVSAAAPQPSARASAAAPREPAGDAAVGPVGVDRTVGARGAFAQPDVDVLVAEALERFRDPDRA